MAQPSVFSDADLVLRVLERDDRNAFAELVRRHQSMLRLGLRRLTAGDDGLADDLAQETFILAWRKIGQFRFESKFSTWLYRIAINAWKSEIRKNREVLLDADSPAFEGSGRDEAGESAARLDLERALARLSDGERAAIVACYYQDLSHEEAAAALDIPLGTVKTHVLKGKNKLRAMLPGWEPKP
jgi:RNA polymerase sigma-70 factor (ECF subfamily)